MIRERARSSESEAHIHEHFLFLSPFHGSQLPKVFRAASFRLCDVHEGQYKDKIQTNDKMECFGFWHQRLKQITAFSSWIQEWQRLERVHSNQGSPGFQQLAEQDSHISPCSAPEKGFPLFYRVFGIKLSHRYLCAQSGADNLGKDTFAFLPIYDRHPCRNNTKVFVQMWKMFKDTLRGPMTLNQILNQLIKRWQWHSALQN